VSNSVAAGSVVVVVVVVFVLLVGWVLFWWRSLWEGPRVLVMTLLHHLTKEGSGVRTGVGVMERLLCGFLLVLHRYAMAMAHNLRPLASSAEIPVPSTSALTMAVDVVVELEARAELSCGPFPNFCSQVHKPRHFFCLELRRGFPRFEAICRVRKECGRRYRIGIDEYLFPIPSGLFG
jgi:hypothetical protein